MDDSNSINPVGTTNHMSGPTHGTLGKGGRDMITGHSEDTHMTVGTMEQVINRGQGIDDGTIRIRYRHVGSRQARGGRVRRLGHHILDSKHDAVTYGTAPHTAPRLRMAEARRGA